jgi:hypothetical protein
VQATVAIDFAGQSIKFCACPCCVSEFMKNPDYYIQRLEGKIAFEGIFGSACSETKDMIYPAHVSTERSAWTGGHGTEP